MAQFMQQHAREEHKGEETQRQRRAACQQEKNILELLMQPALGKQEWPQHQQKPPQSTEVKPDLFHSYGELYLLWKGRRRLGSILDRVPNGSPTHAQPGQQQNVKQPD